MGQMWVALDLHIITHMCLGMCTQSVCNRVSRTIVNAVLRGEVIAQRFISCVCRERMCGDVLCVIVTMPYLNERQKLGHDLELKLTRGVA